MVLTRRIEHPLDMTVQDQGLHCCLPPRDLVLGLRKLCDVFAGVLKGDEAATARQRYWIVEATFPPAISHRLRPAPLGGLRQWVYFGGIATK
jgi:hypothetical protein